MRKSTHYHIDGGYDGLEIFWDGHEIWMKDGEQEIFSMDPDDALKIAEAFKLAAQEAREANA